jgi:hypothetical protein
MTVVLLDAEHPGEPDQRVVVGEDADDVGAPADLAVEALERVGRAQLAPVRRRKRVEGQDVGLGVFEHRGDLGDPAIEVRDRL